MPVTLRHENGPLKTERFSFDEWGMPQLIGLRDSQGGSITAL